jgi:hypothetical protein
VTEVSADLVTALRLFVQMVEGIKKSQRRGNNDALARQMIRKRFSARPLALEGFDRVERVACSAASSSSVAFALMRDGLSTGMPWPDSLRPALVRLSVDIGGDHVVM